MEFKLTNEMERQLNAGGSVTIADIELLSLRFTIKVSNIQGLAYGLATYVNVGDCLGNTYIDGAIINHDSDLQAGVNKYLSSTKDALTAAAKQLHI